MKKSHLFYEHNSGICLKLSKQQYTVDCKINIFHSYISFSSFSLHIEIQSFYTCKHLLFQEIIKLCCTCFWRLYIAKTENRNDSGFYTFLQCCPVLSGYSSVFSIIRNAALFRSRFYMITKIWMAFTDRKMYIRFVFVW